MEQPSFTLRASEDNLRVACQPEPQAKRALGEGW